MRVRLVHGGEFFHNSRILAVPGESLNPDRQQRRNTRRKAHGRGSAPGQRTGPDARKRQTAGAGGGGGGAG
jgi:hypothetical protein